MGRIVKWAWFVFVMRLTGFLPDFKFVMRMRGFLVRPSFRRCGRNFQIGTNVSMIYTSNISVGDDVYIAYGSWIQGIGGVTFEDKAMLGPYTVLATSNHTKRDGAYRFGPGDLAPIVMKHGCWTGAHASIMPGVTIGAGAACAAGAVVTRDVPDNASVGGVPARLMGGSPPA